MITRKQLLSFSVIFWLLILAGCRFVQQGLDAEDMQATADEYIRQLKNLENTAEQMAALTNSALPTVAPLQTLAPTETKRPTLINTRTIEPTDTNPATVSPTSPASAFISGDTNCRSGPSKSYDWVSLIPAGQTVDIIGRDRSDEYYVIRNPYGSGICWLWKAYATQVTSSGNIPVLASPPTKTPTRTASNTPEPRFILKLEQVMMCDGQPSMVVRVYNSNNQPFVSWRAHIFYIGGSGTQESVTGSQFSHKLSECIQTIGSLPPRNTGYAIVPFDPAQGQEFLVEFEACFDTSFNRLCAFDGFRFDIQFLTATPTSTPTPTRTSTRTPTPTRTTPAPQT